MLLSLLLSALSVDGCAGDVGRRMADQRGTICVLIYTTLLRIAGDKLAVQYRLLEEQPANTTVGNVAADVPLDTVYNKDELRYHLITVAWNQPLSNDDDQLSYFTLNADTGLLTTSKVMHICSLSYY